METLNQHEHWLSLSEYAAQYDISVSTLRRRIKSHQMIFKMIDGKYYLPNQSLQEARLATPVPNFQPSLKEEFVSEGGVDESTHVDSQPSEESSAMVNQLVDDLKKAYSQSLQEKEKQILDLRQQIADLKTLVMYLEGENGRLKNS